MLFAAIQRGEWFDDHSGEPLSWLPSDGDTKVHLWVRRWLAEQWAEWAPRTRTSAIEALVRFVSLAVSAQAPDPPNELRSYLRSALRPDRDVEDIECDRWLDAWSLPLSDLTRALLAQVDTELGLGVDGQTLAASIAVRFSDGCEVVHP